MVRSKGDEGYSSWVVQVIAGLFSSWHRLEQPSPEARFPSSHVSGEVMIISPHFTVQTQGVVMLPPVHSYPTAVPEQSALHPTPSVFPSSHISA